MQSSWYNVVGTRMAKVQQLTIPPAWVELLAKITAHFDQMIYPTWATRNFNLSRSAKKANKEKTYIPTIRSIWATLDASTKAQWKSCAAFMKFTNYQYFTTKYSYCRKHGLDLNISPTSLHQLYALFMTNPGGSELVQAERDDVVLLGQISVQFVYKKTEYDVYYGSPFNLHIDAYYFEGGQNLVDTYDWQAPAGNVDWTSVSFSFGVTGRNYFHVVLIWSLS